MNPLSTKYMMSNYPLCPEFYEQYKDSLYRGYKLHIDPTTGYVNVTQLYIDAGVATKHLTELWEDGDFRYELSEIVYELRKEAGLDMEDDYDDSEIYFRKGNNLYIHCHIVDIFTNHIEQRHYYDQDFPTQDP